MLGRWGRIFSWIFCLDMRRRSRSSTGDLGVTCMPYGVTVTRDHVSDFAESAPTRRLTGHGYVPRPRPRSRLSTAPKLLSFSNLLGLMRLAGWCGLHSKGSTCKSASSRYMGAEEGAKSKCMTDGPGSSEGYKYSSGGGRRLLRRGDAKSWVHEQYGQSKVERNLLPFP